MKKVLLVSVDIFRGIKEILFKIKKTIADLSFFQKIVLCFIFIFIVGFRGFYFYKFPLFIDEATSYIYFVSPGFLVSASYYSGPNNHVFYSELCALLQIFFNDPLLIMRLPSFIASLTLSILLFISVNRYYGFLTGLLALVLFSFSDHVTFYSIQGRGYSVLALFTFISSFFLVKYLFQRKNIYLLFFILSSVLGFYTIPVFLYPFLSLAIFALLIVIINRWWEQVFRFFLIFTLIGILVILLYLPVFLFNDLNTIIGNPWIASSKNFISELPSYILRVNDYLWNMENGIIITLLVVTGVVYFLLINKKTEESLFGLLFLMVPLVVIFFQKVLPFERIWLYLFILLSFGLSYFIVQLISAFIKDHQVRNIFIGTFIFSAMTFMLISESKAVLSKSFGYYKEMEVLVNEIYKEAPMVILAGDYDCNTYIKYKFIVEGKAVNVKPLSRPSDKFDMIVTSGKFPSGIDASLYSFAFSNSYVKAYRLKK